MEGSMQIIQIFNNPEFGEVRTVEMNGEPWLVGKDVAIPHIDAVSAYNVLAMAYNMPKDVAVKVIRIVRDEFCNRNRFDSTIWNLSCAVLECISAENYRGEFNIHRLFQENFSKIGCGRVINKKNDPRFIPDAWVKIGSDEIPVEIKLHNFNQAAVNQLNQYMKFYHSRKGIAVGERLTVAIPPEINFIPISMLLINK